MGMMDCVNHRYKQKREEIMVDVERLVRAVRGIPVQFRTGELSDALRAAEAIDPSSTDSIKAHAQRLIDAVAAAPAEYKTNSAVDAALHLNRVLATL